MFKPEKAFFCIHPVTTNLQFLQNKTSLFAKVLIEVGIIPQYRESSSQLGHFARSFIIPNSFLRFNGNLMVL